MVAAVVAVGSPLAACLPGPTGITLHHALFPSVCHGSAWLAPHSPCAPCCHHPWAPLGGVLSCWESSQGSCWVWLYSTAMGHFWGFPSTCFPPPARHLSLTVPVLLSCRLQAILVPAVPSHLSPFLHRFTRVLCQMSHWGTLCFPGCHWPVLLWGSAVLWLWARSPHRHRAAHRDLLLQKLPGL